MLLPCPGRSAAHSSRFRPNLSQHRSASRPAPHPGFTTSSSERQERLHSLFQHIAEHSDFSFQTDRNTRGPPYRIYSCLDYNRSNVSMEWDIDMDDTATAANLDTQGEVCNDSRDRREGHNAHVAYFPGVRTVVRTQ